MCLQVASPVRHSVLPACFTLVGGYLIGPDADLYLANLTGLDLSNADLAGANLYAATLSYANLTDADLSGASLALATLQFTISPVQISTAPVWPLLTWTPPT